MTDIVLFTEEYPFTLAGESFLEPELPILAENFGRIFILPHRTASHVRPVPDNVEVVTMPWVSPPGPVTKLRALGSVAAARVAGSALAEPGNVLRNRHASRKGADLLAQNVLKARMLAPWIRERRLGEAIFYDYWLENVTTALSLLRKEGEIQTAVARAHSADVFDGNHNGVTAPFRRFKAQGLDAIFPTSEAAARHLASRVPASRGKLHVHRLGVSDPGGAVPARPLSSPPVVLTCAHLLHHKRIDLVPEVIASVGTAVSWIHIGDGPARALVEHNARRYLTQGSWTLAGALSNREVLHLYRSTSVSLLLSMSEAEGLPVSMMEALSFGVPIVARDVGGVSEIVSGKTGILVHEAGAIKDFASAVRRVLATPGFDTGAIREEWRGKFHAATNYNRFAAALEQVHRRG